MVRDNVPNETCRCSGQRSARGSRLDLSLFAFLLPTEWAPQIDCDQQEQHRAGNDECRDGVATLTEGSLLAPKT